MVQLQSCYACDNSFNLHDHIFLTLSYITFPLAKIHLALLQLLHQALKLVLFSTHNNWIYLVISLATQNLTSISSSFFPTIK